MVAWVLLSGKANFKKLGKSSRGLLRAASVMLLTACMLPDKNFRVRMERATPSSLLLRTKTP